jgi:uncharacterized LabA/DUF88 family protein
VTSSLQTTAATIPGACRIRIFVDFWNLQLTLKERETKYTRQNSNFNIDWLKLAGCLVAETAQVLGVGNAVYEGCIVFTSSDLKTPEGRKYHKWATTWLDRQPGIQVKCFERRPKHPPKCPACHHPIPKCPHPSCGADLVGTVEKGVDTAIATDMIRLAWEKAYDVAILASSDADLVPAVEFLDQKGIRVIQAGFPPLGSELSRACWATIDVFALRNRFRRVGQSG